MTYIEKAVPSDAGCYVDGQWGQYATARMIGVAKSFGYADAESIDLAERKLAAMLPSIAPGLTDDEEESLVFCADDAEQWLNTEIAPDGYSFGWFDGEFFLQSDEWWSEV